MKYWFFYHFYYFFKDRLATHCCFHFCEFVEEKLALPKLNRCFAWKLIRIIENIKFSKARSFRTGFSKSLKMCFLGDFVCLMFLNLINGFLNGF